MRLGVPRRLRAILPHPRRAIAINGLGPLLLIRVRASSHISLDISIPFRGVRGCVDHPLAETTSYMSLLFHILNYFHNANIGVVTSIMLLRYVNLVINNRVHHKQGEVTVKVCLRVIINRGTCPRLVNTSPVLRPVCRQRVTKIDQLRKCMVATIAATGRRIIPFRKAVDRQQEETGRNVMKNFRLRRQRNGATLIVGKVTTTFVVLRRRPRLLHRQCPMDHD